MLGVAGAMVLGDEVDRDRLDRQRIGRRPWPRKTISLISSRSMASDRAMEKRASLNTARSTGSLCPRLKRSRSSPPAPGPGHGVVAAFPRSPSAAGSRPGTPPAASMSPARPSSEQVHLALGDIGFVDLGDVGQLLALGVDHVEIGVGDQAPALGGVGDDDVAPASASRRQADRLDLRWHPSAAGGNVLPVRRCRRRNSPPRPRWRSHARPSARRRRGCGGP
jgi:hypothetical protein